MHLPASSYPRTRKFLPENFKVTVWSKLKPYYTELLHRPLDTEEVFERWILDITEIQDLFDEDLAWRYIQLLRDTNSSRVEESFQYAIQELLPKAAYSKSKIYQKLLNSEYTRQLDKTQFGWLVDYLQNRINLTDKKNFALLANAKIRSKEYGKIISNIKITINGIDHSLHQAFGLLQSANRENRELVYQLICSRLGQHSKTLHDLLNDLIALRHQISLSAALPDYLQYVFKARRRNDYSPEDCQRFQDTVLNTVIPIVEKLDRLRIKHLATKRLRPWDIKTDLLGLSPVVAFSDGKSLLEKSISCLDQIHPLFAECLKSVQDLNQYDLEARLGKSPGAFYIPLSMTGVPFLIMNATGAAEDISTMMQLSGKTVQSFLIRDLPLFSARRITDEISELAGQTMSLISMEHWNIFIPQEDELRRVKIRALESSLRQLLRIAALDKFQHWLYTHPQHKVKNREYEWRTILQSYTSQVVDYAGLEHCQSQSWQHERHIFEAPLYCMAIGIAQLGAIEIWRNYRTDPARTKEQFLRALTLGNTKSNKEVYATAGASFDFSPGHISDLILYLNGELEELLVKQGVD